MQRKQIIQWIVLGVLVAGALVLRLTGLTPAGFHAFRFGPNPLDRLQFLFAVVPWLVFSLYWEYAAKNAAPVHSSESKSSRAVHVFLTNAAVLLEIVQLHAIPRYLPLSAPILAAGMAVSTLGLVLCIWARRHLGRNWSGNITIKVGHQLIRSGPYRLLRHPIYTGILTMYAGTAIVSGSTLALVGLAMALFAYARKLRLEEASLRVAFPADYEAYRRQTWALIPGLF
ncbi:MAG: isoprenylcysteine carboxylmethyltransferase family protein [Terracidiphilus sp.]|nr:isoprenylcysteine carboxylmethyltransferase family protein [Terracidiphilus sp.]